eukprot:50329-Pyramimonas_sp.AAC.1
MFVLVRAEGPRGSSEGQGPMRGSTSRQINIKTAQTNSHQNALTRTSNNTDNINNIIFVM